MHQNLGVVHTSFDDAVDLCPTVIMVGAPFYSQGALSFNVPLGGAYVGLILPPFVQQSLY
jgi:hypothetical protein